MLEKKNIQKNKEEDKSGAKERFTQSVSHQSAAEEQLLCVCMRCKKLQHTDTKRTLLGLK
jgi:hypothetical protein